MLQLQLIDLCVVLLDRLHHLDALVTAVTAMPGRQVEETDRLIAECRLSGILRPAHQGSIEPLRIVA